MTARERAPLTLLKVMHHPLAVPLGVLVLVLAMFADVLFFPNGRALSIRSEDFATQFFYFYDFGFRELKQGNLPLWNPHVFSGTPWFGNFESALLYPPQYIFMLLPAGIAVNWFIAFHVFLLGCFVSLWARHHRLHPVAQLVAASCAMFGSAYFFRIMPGHTTIIATQAWLPLVLLCVDKLLDGRQAGASDTPLADARGSSVGEHSLGWILCGSFAVAMQLLAGHPQSAFRTGVVVALYGALRLFQARENWRAALSIPLFYLGAVALAAVQVGAGLVVAGESTRQGAVPIEFAALFPFPPENILTLLVPSFFGNYADMIYWGRNLPWEATLYIGVGGLALAIYGAIFGRLNAIIKPRRWIFAVMVVVLLLLALGSNLPLFYWLYAYVPGFNKFRTTAEFIFPASIFLSLLAGIGLDSLFHQPQRVRWVSMLLGILAGASIAEAITIQYWAAQETGGLWGRLISAMRDSKSTVMSGSHPDVFLNPTFRSSAADYAFTNLVVCAGVCLILSFLIYRAKYSRRAVYLVALLAVVEVAGFARLNRPTFPLAYLEQPTVQSFLKERKGDVRILNLASLNSAMSLGQSDIWGYDPVMLKRYVEFIAWTQGQSPDGAVISVDFKEYHPLYQMLRHRYTFIPEGHDRQQVRIAETPGALPRFLLINDYRVLAQRDAIFAAMNEKSFDPRRSVILQQEPEPKPAATKARIVRGGVLDDSTDHVTIDLEITQPAILLITDSYSRYWKTTAQSGSIQSEYQVLPANYVLRAIPLQKGRHLFRMEYAPAPFHIGKWISVVTLFVYMGLLGWWWHLRTSKRHQGISKNHWPSFPRRWRPSSNPSQVQ